VPASYAREGVRAQRHGGMRDAAAPADGGAASQDRFRT
jgi:hypothetical protein